MRIAVHGGKVGDLVFSIPAARVLGVTDYWLVAHPPGHVCHTSIEAAVPLLESQGFRVRVVRGGGVFRVPDGSVRMDLFHTFQRRLGSHQQGRFLNLVERHFVALGLPIDMWHGPWLRVEPRRVANCVFVRSARYRPARPQFDWRALAVRYRDESVFIGTVEEWRVFSSEFGVPVRYFRTHDLSEAAGVLAGCVLCVTNQTGLHAVAEGLGCNIVLERCERIDDCVFVRPGRAGRRVWPVDGAEGWGLDLRLSQGFSCCVECGWFRGRAGV